MAVTTQILNDGPRNHVVHLDIDAANTNAVVVDTSAWSQASEYPECKVTRIQWSLTGGGAQLLWNATANIEFFECTAGEGDQCYQDIGGIINNAGAGKDGDILLTNAAGVTEGSITLWCQKRA